MSATLTVAAPGIRFGPLLRRWRTVRRLSQLDLSLTAEVSSRHLSFLESGRASPSRRMVLGLADALELPFREQNLLLQAAGYAPVFRETRLDAPDMAGVRKALELILQGHEPYRALALTRRWDVVMVNRPQAAALTALTGQSIPPLTVLPTPSLNLLRLLFEPAVRSLLVNWEVVARAVLSRAHREAVWTRDQALENLVQQHAVSLPAITVAGAPEEASAPVISVEMRSGTDTLRFLTTITTLGAPQDVALQELRIEAYYPADEFTDRWMRGECQSSMQQAT